MLLKLPELLLFCYFFLLFLHFQLSSAQFIYAAFAPEQAGLVKGYVNILSLCLNSCTAQKREREKINLKNSPRRRKRFIELLPVLLLLKSKFSCTIAE